MKKLFLPVLASLCLSCGNDPLPRPKAYLRLDYQKPEYKRTYPLLPLSFEKNELSENISSIKVDEKRKSYGIDIHYPSLRGTVYLTYKKVNDSNLNELLRDAQNITQKHVVKADEIAEQPYINEDKKVFGMFYEVAGDAASQSQFYVTDSISHFMSGSLYFYAKPNYDSIYPAAEYLKNDIKHIMETLEWRNNKP